MHSVHAIAPTTLAGMHAGALLAADGADGTIERIMADLRHAADGARGHDAAVSSLLMRNAIARALSNTYDDDLGDALDRIVETEVVEELRRHALATTPTPGAHALRDANDALQAALDGMRLRIEAFADEQARRDAQRAGDTALAA